MESNNRQGGTEVDQSQTQPANYGVTSPISLAEPKPQDIKLSRDLEAVLRPHGMFETDEELTHRMEILGKLDSLVKQWVRDVSVQKSIPPSVAEHVRYLLNQLSHYHCNCNVIIVCIICYLIIISCHH